MRPTTAFCCSDFTVTGGSTYLYENCLLKDVDKYAVKIFRPCTQYANLFIGLDPLVQ
jgi:hypothetical protein